MFPSIFFPLIPKKILFFFISFELIDALLIKNGSTIVYVIEDNIAKLKTVKTGIPYQDSIEIIKGLNEGEKVVTRGNERLRPNQKVQIEEAK